MKSIEKKLGEELPENIKVDYKKAIEDAWDLGQDFSNGSNNPQTSNINATALNFFNTAMKFDIGKQFTVEKGYFEQAVRDALETGKIQDVVDALEKQLIGNIKDNALVDKIDYIVRGHILRARNSSRLYRYEDVGIKRVEIIAILDQKTSHICRAMHGKTVEIKTLTTYTKEFFNDDPTRPSFWENRRNPTEEQLRSLKPETLSGDEITKVLNHKMPPYHPRCRTTVIASFFTESKTIAEAEQYAIDKGLAMKASYKDVPLYVANGINEQLLNLKNKYDYNYNFIQSGKLKKEIISNGQKVYNNPAFGNFDKINTLAVNIEYFNQYNSLDELNKHIAKTNNRIIDGMKGWNAKELKDLVDHEFGHLLTTSTYKENAKGKTGKEFDDLVGSKYNTSWLSNQDGMERLAEIFVLFEQDKSSVSDSFLKEFNKYSIKEISKK